jgi:hypothetical protein
MNGTGRDGLREQYRTVAEAVSNAIDTVSQNGPHGRDYYVQIGNAYHQAREEHEARLFKLRSVLAEIESILDHIENS